MPKIGLRHIVFAPIQKENPMAKPTYGKGVVLGGAMAANVRFNTNNTKQYTDNVLSAVDKSVTGGSIELTMDDIRPEGRVSALGARKIENDDGSTTYRTGGTPAPYGGVGFIEELRVNGVTKHLPTWVYKTAFAPADKEAKTKGENTEFQQSTVKGEFMGLVVDESGEQTFTDDKVFDTAKEALDWINKMANITELGV